MKKFIIIIISLFLLFTTGCSSKENENLENNKQNSVKEEIYGLNDLITLNNGTGTMNLKFLSIKETDDRNEFEEKEYEKVIFIEYYYENVDLEDDFYIDEDIFKVYDKGNKILETYPLEVNFAQAISKGRNATNKIAYGLNNKENYIEIELCSQSTGKSFNKKVILEW